MRAILADRRVNAEVNIAAIHLKDTDKASVR
jgi:hypothetical protein